MSAQEKGGQAELESLRKRILDLEQRLGEVEQAAHRLAQVDERFRLVCSATRDIIYDWALDSDTLWLNDNSGNALGKIGEHTRTIKWWEESVHPDDRRRVATDLKQAIGGDTVYWTGEYKFRYYDQSYAHIQERGFIVRDASGKARRMIGVMSDVTDRAQFENEILRLAAFPNENPHPVIEADADGTIKYTNPSCRDLIKARQLPIEELLPRDHQKLVQDCLKHSSTTTSETTIGNRIIAWSYQPVAEQKIVHIYGKDVTEDRQREKLLIETERRSEAILQAIPDLIFRLTREGKYLDVRGADFGALLRPPEEMIGSYLADHQNEPEFSAKALRLINEALDHQSLRTYEYQLTPISGKRSSFEARILPLGPEEVLWIARDITQRKEAEKLSLALKDLGERLSAVSSSKEAAEVIVFTAREILGWDMCFVAFISESDNKSHPLLLLDTRDGQMIEYSEDYNRTYPITPVMKLVLAKGGLLIRDRDADLNLTLFPVGNDRRAKSLIYVAIREGEKKIGMISIQSYTRRAYDERALETVKLLADFCAAAMSRTRAQDALRESELRYRRAIRHGGAVLYQFDYNTRSWTFIDEGISDLTGYAASEITALGFREMVKDIRFYGDTHSYTIEEAVEKFRQRKFDDWKADYLIVTRDGSERWVADSAVGITDENGEIVSSLGIMQDITERRDAEKLTEALRDLGENLNQVTSTREAAEIVARAADRLLGWDACLFSIYDEEKNKIQYVLSIDTVNGVRTEFPRDYNKSKDPTPLFNKILHEGPLLISRNFQDAQYGRSAFGDSERMSESLLYVPVRARHGALFGVLSIQSYTKNYYTEKSLNTLKVLAEYCSSAIARANAQDALSQSEARMRFLFDHLSAVLWTTDRNLRMTSLTGGGRPEMTGDPSRMIGQDMESILAGMPSAEAAMEAHRAALHGISQIYDFTVNDRVMQCHLDPVMNEKGEVISLIGIGHDVTEVRRAEEEHRQLEMRIQHAQKLESLGVLAGGIAHDFNNLLSGILGNAGLAMMELPRVSPARPTIESIEKAAVRAADLTRQMLAYSGRGKFVVEEIELNELVREMIQLLQVSISKRAVLKPLLAEYPVVMRGDISQIHQILMNLITNASDALEERSGVICITTGVMYAERDYLGKTYFFDHFDEGFYAFVEVSDTGCGMDEQTLSRIFDPFFTTKFTGRGLGLAATLGIIRGHKGVIKVESQIGRGTTFRVLFPNVESEESKKSVSDRAPGLAKLAGTALIIDDEETVVSVLRRTLERSGVQVVTATDAVQGLTKLRQRGNEINIVLLDMTMPGMNGSEAYAEIRRLNATLPVILMSGYNEQDAVNRFHLSGIADFLHKPFRPQEVIEKVRKALCVE